jgi:hypothetical protein
MPKSKARAAITASRRVEVAKLLRASVPVYRIAERLGINHKTATADTNFLLDLWAQEQKPEDRHRWRARELAKLDEIEIKVAANARAGHEGAIDRVLKVMERRAKYLGLDAPTKVDVNAAELQKEVAGLIRQLAGLEPGEALGGQGAVLGEDGEPGQGSLFDGDQDTQD